MAQSVEIATKLPWKMVDLSIVFCKRLHETWWLSTIFQSFPMKKMWFSMIFPSFFHDFPQFYGSFSCGPPEGIGREGSSRPLVGGQQRGEPNESQELQRSQQQLLVDSRGLCTGLWWMDYDGSSGSGLWWMDYDGWIMMVGLYGASWCGFYWMMIDYGWLLIMDDAGWS